MWHDDPGDEGEDGPAHDAVPDPSARHWRHPSELRNQHALPLPEPSPAVTAGRLDSPLWPVLAVGGVLALAAIGVLGFQAGMRGRTGVDAGTAAPLLPDDAIDARLPVPTPIVDPGATTAPTTTTTIGVRSTQTTHELPAAGAATSWGTASSDLADVVPPVRAQNAPAYGLYPAPGQSDQRLGSFVAVADVVLTSAAAVGDLDTVWLRVERNWVEALVVGVDPMTDLAVLQPVEPDVSLPWLAVASEPIQPGRGVLVGYGDPGNTGDGLVDEGRAHEGSGDDVDGDRPVDDGDPTTSEADDTAAEAERAAAGATGEATDTDDGATTDDPSPDGSTGDDGGDDADRIEEPDADDEDEASDDEVNEDPTSAGGSDPMAAPAERSAKRRADHDWAEASERRGLVYSTTDPLTTTGNRRLHHSIMAVIDPRPGDSGAPLRNRRGELVGLVVAGDAPQVAALPIDRAIATARSLLEFGSGDPAWLGVEIQPSEDGRGLLVSAVADASSAPLLPGDVIVAVDNTPATHPDRLGFAARQAGPGGQLLLTFDRDGRRWTMAIEVGTHPAAP
ncbi:MAG: hypothetical protein AAGA93_16415 [Actinomycetota bacterium]